MIEDVKLCLNGCFELKPRSAFGRHPRSPDGLQARCRDCERERMMRRRHGLSATEKDDIAAAQDGCAICGRLEPGRKGWVVDHDHGCCSGEVSCEHCRRGLLCQWCNNAIGYAMDSPEILRAAADYLELQTRLAAPIALASRWTESEGAVG